MIGVSVWCIFILVFYNAGITSAAKWDYQHIEESWPKQCFVGKLQSPIALSIDIAQGKYFPPFKFDGYDDFYRAIIKNNGHTVEVRLESTKKPTLSGGGISGDYVLDSLHFHWESEHTIDDRRFPLELHLVHYDNRAKDLLHALSFNRVAVLGVLFYVSPDEDSEFHPLFNAIQQLQQHQPLIIPRLELDDFLPRDRAGFYRYNGSLTTPECTEGVTWTVFTNGLPISSAQLKYFSKLLTESNVPIGPNYKPLQELNDRNVFLKLSGMEGAANCISIKNFLKLSTLFTIITLVL